MNTKFKTIDSYVNDCLPAGTVRPSLKVMGLVVMRPMLGTGGWVRRLSFTHIVRYSNLFT